MIFNLLYHVTPTADYKWNIEQIQQDFEKFDGRIVVAIATAKDFDSPETVKAMFPAKTKFILVPNNIDLREVASFELLLQEVSTPVDPLKPEWTFYAHTKGITHFKQTMNERERRRWEACRLWTELLYKYNLDFRTISHLGTVGMSGVFASGAMLRYGHFANFPEDAPDWHFCGTFFWFNNKQLFSRPWREAIKPHRYGAEIFLGNVFRRDEVNAWPFDNVDDPYDFRYTSSLAQPRHITLITCTGERQYQFSLCERWMKRQTIGWHEWIVIDDCKPRTKIELATKVIRPCPSWHKGVNTQQRNLLVALDNLSDKADLIYFIEDDDYYRPQYLEMASEQMRIARAEILGVAGSTYVHLPQKKRRRLINKTWSPLFQTVLQGPQVLLAFKNFVKQQGTRIDVDFWRKIVQLNSFRFSLVQNDILSIGIKGLPGRAGLGVGHEPDNTWRKENVRTIREMFDPEDWQHYRNFVR